MNRDPDQTVGLDKRGVSVRKGVGKLMKLQARDYKENKEYKRWRLQHVREHVRVFVEEERENELEQLFEAGLERQQHNPAEEDEAEGAGLAGAGAEAAGAGRRSIESVKGAERVLEALRVLREEAARRDEHEQA